MVTTFPDRAALVTALKAKAIELGFHKVGIAAVPETPQDWGLQNWLRQGYQAEMAWMATPQRQDLNQVLPGVKSVISVALNYYTATAHSDDPNIGKISRYGWGRDYHRVIQKRLKALGHWLDTEVKSWKPAESQEESPKTGEKFQWRAYVDTGPVQDKAWAQRSGLGWVGKHGNLITRDYGSWVFLGEILTTLDLSPDRPHTAHCGTCSRCLEACPTGAIVAPAVVDANRCIAYHTIENRSPQLPPKIAQNLHGWVAGCDICQDVCPWNQRFAQETDITDFQPYPHNINPPLQELANLSEAEWDQRFTGSALRRIKPAQWRRNAQANLKNLP
ncbi:MAG: tRNA epoxyqueuosine(34) reductase QueG [Prochlorothrix sp.]